MAEEKSLRNHSKLFRICNAMIIIRHSYCDYFCDQRRWESKGKNEKIYNRTNSSSPQYCLPNWGTITIASFVRNGQLSLLIMWPLVSTPTRSPKTQLNTEMLTGRLLAVFITVVVAKPLEAGQPRRSIFGSLLIHHWIKSDSRESLPCTDRITS